MIGMSEAQKALEIQSCFLEAYKSPLSMILIDDLERIIEYIRVGPRFGNSVLQALLILLRKPPPAGRRLLVVGTTAIPVALEDLSLTQSFNLTCHVPLLEGGGDEVVKVLVQAGGCTEADAKNIAGSINRPIGVKKLLLLVEMARSNSQAEGKDSIDLNIFLECLHTVGY